MRRLHEGRLSGREAIRFMQAGVREIECEAARGVFVLKVMLHPRLDHFQAIAGACLVTGEGEVAQVGRVGHRGFFHPAVIGHARRIIAFIIPSKNPPGDGLAVGIIRRVNPAADLALGN